MLVHTSSVEEQLDRFSTDSNTGLTSSQVEKQLETFGPNKLVGQKKKNWFQKFLEQMKDVVGRFAGHVSPSC